LPYNQNLVESIRINLEDHTSIIDKKMFGGVGFILLGNMTCEVLGNDLITHIGIENNDLALSQPFVRQCFAPGGKPLASWVLVSQERLETDRDLQQWIELGYNYASTLSEKE
jgi:hypothetical protein